MFLEKPGKKRRQKWDGDPLLEPYYPGIAKLDQELYDSVVERSMGMCEICGKEKAEEVHHLCGRRRKAWGWSLMHLCRGCHKPPNGIHANGKLYEEKMKNLQDVYFAIGYSEDQVRWLLGTKSGRLF